MSLEGFKQGFKQVGDMIGGLDMNQGCPFQASNKLVMSLEDLK
jgi:hypothetical protein